MRNFPGNVSQCIKGHLIYLYDQRREGMRVKQRVWKGICNQEPSPIYFTSPKPLPSILFFQLPQQPSYLRASLPLSCTILIAFYLFFLNCNLDCITHPLIDLKLLPHYLSNYKLLGLHDPWKSHMKLFFYPGFISLLKVFYATHRLNYILVYKSATCFSAIWSSLRHSLHFSHSLFQLQHLPQNYPIIQSSI